MHWHFSYYILYLEPFFTLQLLENVHFIHYLHHCLSLTNVLLLNYTIESSSIQSETYCFGLCSNISTSFCIIKHRNFSKHLSFNYCFDVNLATICVSVAVQFSLIHNKYLISYIALFYYHCSLVINDFICS